MKAHTQLFLDRLEVLTKRPGSSLDPLLSSWINDEDSDVYSPKEAFASLIDVFEGPPVIRTTHKRVVPSEEQRFRRYLFPLVESSDRSSGRSASLSKNAPWRVRRDNGASCTVASLEDFQRNWDKFTGGCLKYVEWDNVVAAGGSVLACLTADTGSTSNSDLGPSFAEGPYAKSDVDLFIYGLDLFHTGEKIKEIRESISYYMEEHTAVEWVKTQNTISVQSGGVFRTIQIIRMEYESPSKVLKDFDFGAPCVLYNGSAVFANPRGIISLMTQCNVIDFKYVSQRPVAHHSKYETRLIKYAMRGFEIYLPNLRRKDINQNIFNMLASEASSLSLLLILEHRFMKGLDPETGLTTGKGKHCPLARMFYRRLTQAEAEMRERKAKPCTITNCQFCVLWYQYNQGQPDSGDGYDMAVQRPLDSESELGDYSNLQSQESFLMGGNMKSVHTPWEENVYVTEEKPKTERVYV